MNPGLKYLLRKAPQARWRAMRRRLPGWRLYAVGFGALLLVAVVALPRVLRLVDADMDASVMEATRDHAEAFRVYGPLALIAMGLLSMSAGKGLYFRPAEVDFLFPAPVSRRQLLLYNVSGRLIVQLLSSAWVSIFVGDYFGTFLGGLVGVCLSFAFVQFLAQVASVATAVLDRRVTGALRWVLFAVLAVGAVAIYRSAHASLGEGITAREAAARILESPLVAAVSLPTRPFIATITAPTLLGAAGSAALSLGVLAALLGALLAFDAAFLEASLAYSQKVQARIDRMKSGEGVFASAKGTGSRTLRVPKFPRLGGAGPLARRQVQEMLRNPRGIGGMFVTGLIFMAVFTGALRMSDAAGGAGAGIGVFASLFFVTLMMQNCPYDFRRDLDRMDVLKALPIPPFAVACGQVIPGALLLGVLQFATALPVMVALGALRTETVLAIAFVLPPAALAVTSLDNVIGLILPTRPVNDDPGNLPFLFRTMMVMTLKLASLGLIACGGGAIGALTYYLSGERLAVAGAGAGVFLLAASVPLLFGVGRLFARFDVARDVPA